MIITKKMQEELEKEGYLVDDFIEPSNMKNMAPEMAGAYLRAKENLEEEQSKESEKKEPKQAEEQVEEQKKNRTWSEKMHEANQTLGFAENQVYELDKGAAMDMAADYAKKRGFSKRAVMKAVAEVVDARSNDYYGEQMVEQEEEKVEMEDLEEKEENDRFAYPEVDDYTQTLERVRHQ